MARRQRVTTSRSGSPRMPRTARNSLRTARSISSSGAATHCGCDAPPKSIVNEAWRDSSRARPSKALELKRMPRHSRPSFAGTRTPTPRTGRVNESRATKAVTVTSIVLLFLLDVTDTPNNPSLGFFTYIIFPSLLAFGLALVVLGALLERRRRRRLAPGKIARYPSFDLNDPRRRRNFLGFLAALFIFLFASAFGSYRAYEYTESVQFCGQTCHTVMNPEFTAYLASAHARVKCVECHVGPGADWYVRSKLSGAYQLYSVTFNKYPRPIKTPVHSLRPAQETCEQCHWPAKFFGAQLKVFNRYAYDEKNTLRQTRMLINTGGGSPETGLVTGIHWHMNIANEITYFSTDEQRQVIPWVRARGRDGVVTEYRLEGAPVTQEQIDQTPKRRMDCVDCHNRPTHVYVPPDRAVNETLTPGKLDPSLPFLNLQAADAL